MHTVKPKDSRPHLGIEFEHFMPGKMSRENAREIYEEIPAKIRPMVDYSWEVLNYGPTEYGYEAKLCTPQDEYAANLAILLEYLRAKKAILLPECGTPRFGLHVHVDLRNKDYTQIVKIKTKLLEKRQDLLKYVDKKRIVGGYWSSAIADRGYGTVEVRMMDSNFDLKKRIIPYIQEIINIKNLAEAN